MATVTGTKRKLSINVEALEANNTLTLGSNAVATQSWVTSTIIDGAPDALNTLNELAAAINDTSNYASTVTTALGNRLRIDAAQGLNATQQSQGRSNLGLGTAATSNTGDFASSGHNHDSAYWRTTRSVSLTGSNPFDDAKTETRVTGTGNYVISYTGASAQLISSATGGSASIFQIGAHYNGSDFYMRTRTDSTTWQTWKKLWHTGNLNPSDYALANHTHSGYASSSHNHDDRYYTESESDNRFIKLDFDVITNANANSSSNGTWANYGNNTAWGSYKVGDDATAGATYNDGSGWIEYEVPEGMSTCYFGQLRWDSGGYFDVYAKKSDGSLIHRGRFISKNTVENDNHSGDHDGQQILKVSGFDDANITHIRFQNRTGRLHLQGLGWTKEQDTAGSQDSQTHWDLIYNKPSTFSPSSHNHDDRYYTETEVNTLLDGKAASSHNHDDRYYTETEVNNLLTGKANSSHSHSISDITNLQTTLDSKAASSHNHDDRYYTETEVNDITHQWEWRWQRWRSLVQPAGGDANSWTNYYKTYFTERSIATDASYPIEDRGYINTNTNVGVDGGFGGSTYGNIFGNLEQYHCLIYTNIYVEREFTVSVSNFNGDDPHAIFVDGVFVHGNTGCCVDTSYSYTFTTGWHRIDLIYSEGGGGDWIRMGWNPKDYTTYISDMTPHRAGESPRKVLEKLNNLDVLATQTWVGNQGYLTSLPAHTHSEYAASNHNHTYNVNDSWLRDNGDNAHVKLYGNSRQMVFRTDGTSEYNSGVGGYPFAWMYGGDAASNRRMLLNSSGQLWLSNYGWLHEKFSDVNHNHDTRYLTSEQVYTQLATKADASHSHDLIVERPNIQYGTGFLQWTDLSGTGGTGLSGSQPQNPFSDWHHHLIMNHANGSGYYVDLAFSFHSDRIHFRRKAGTDPTPWKELIHSGNIGTQTVAHAYAATSIPWSGITSKPSSFTPSSHTHAISDVTGLQGALDAKQPVGSYAGASGTYNNDFYVNALYYDDWVRNHTNTNGIYWSTTGWHLYPIDNDDFRVRSGNTSSAALRFNTGGTDRNYVYCNSSNEIGFLNTSRSWIFRVTNTGTATATGDVVAFSDRRLKENIETIPNALEKVEALRGVTFTRKDTGKDSIGLIAQEVEEVIPEVVNNEGEYKGVAYGNLVGVLIEAVKELSAEVKELKAKLGE